MTVQHDSIILKNQPIAREGRLPYRTMDGRVLWKLKKWDDLKANIGRRVPIIDEHPSPHNGRGGLFNGQKRIEGWATIKQYKNYKMLAADMELLDDFAEKNGFSCGYPYIPLIPDERDRVFDGGPVDEIQSQLQIDHIAFTDDPREPTGLLSAWDAISIQNTNEIPIEAAPTVHAALDSRSSGIDSIPKYAIAYDSIRCIVDLDSIKSREDIETKIRISNPGIAADKLARLVERQFQNQFRHENMRHLFKKEGDALMAGETEDKNNKKKKKGGKGQSEDLMTSKNPDEVNKKGSGPDQMGMDDVDSLIASFETRIAGIAQDTNDKFSQMVDILKGLSTEVGEIKARSAADALTSEVNGIVKTLKETFGFSDTDLDGMSKDTLEGMLKSAKLIGARRTQLGQPRALDARNFGITTTPGGRVSFDAQNYLVYDAQAGRMVLPAHVQKQLQGGSS